jgi:hypothetical protein
VVDVRAIGQEHNCKGASLLAKAAWRRVQRIFRRR